MNGLALMDFQLKHVFIGASLQYWMVQCCLNWNVLILFIFSLYCWAVFFSQIISNLVINIASMLLKVLLLFGTFYISTLISMSTVLPSHSNIAPLRVTIAVCSYTALHSDRGGEPFFHLRLASLLESDIFFATNNVSDSYRL